MATLNEARRAKAEARKVLAGLPELNGVGIARWAGTERWDRDYGVKVNVKSPPARGRIPNTIIGVPVTIEINSSRIRQ